MSYHVRRVGRARVYDADGQTKRALPILELGSISNMVTSDNPEIVGNAQNRTSVPSATSGAWISSSHHELLPALDRASTNWPTRSFQWARIHASSSSILVHR